MQDANSIDMRGTPVDSAAQAHSCNGAEPRGLLHSGDEPTRTETRYKYID